MGVPIPGSTSGTGGTGGALPSGQVNLVTVVQSGGSPDTISTVGGVNELGQISSQTSIADYTNIRDTILAWFNRLIQNAAGDNSQNIMSALMQLLGQLPTPQQIQNAFNTASTAATNANTDINSLNTYNSTLSTDGSTITTSGTGISTDASDISGTAIPTSGDYNTVSDLITQYENGKITLSSLNSNLNTILSSNQLLSSGMVSTYNSSAQLYQNYTTAVSDYNSTVSNPPVSQTQYNSDQQAIANYNSADAAAGNIFPTLSTIPDTTVVTTPLNSTTTTITSGTYDNSVTWPSTSNYNFTTKDSNGNTVPNTTALNQFLTDFQTSITDFTTTQTSMNTTLSDFNTNDYTVQSGQLPTLPLPTLSTITVPTFIDFETQVLAAFTNSSTATAVNLNSLFGSTVDANNPSQTPQAQDQQAIDQLIQKSTNAVGAIGSGLGAVGGVAILNLGGLTNFEALSTTFQSQLAATNTSIADNPNLSTSALDFWRTVGNHLQSIIGASSVLGTIAAFRDASNFFYTSDNLNRPLLALNDLESYNSLLGSNLNATLLGLAAQNAPAATTADQQILANGGAIPLAYSAQIQRDALGSQAVQGDQKAFSALYLAGFTASVINGVIAKGNLTAEQQQSVVQAESTLGQFLAQNKVTFQTLNNQAEVANAFQAAGQQLQALGYTISPIELANAQKAFFANLPTGPIGAAALQQLLITAIANNVPNVPANVVANAVQFQFIQNEASYRVEVQNDFKQNRQINTTQAQTFSDRFTEALQGKAYDNTVQFVVNSESANDQEFAEELAELTVDAQQDLIENNVLEGAPNVIPGTDIMNTAIVAKNDVTPVVTEKRTGYIPV